MDLTQQSCYKVIVERKGFTFYVELKYENLPDYCTHCNIIDHHLDNCKQVKKQVNDQTDKEPIVKKKVNKPHNQIYKKLRDGRIHKDNNKEVL
jgi:hypothetical protein